MLTPAPLSMYDLPFVFDFLHVVFRCSYFTADSLRSNALGPPLRRLQRRHPSHVKYLDPATPPEWE